MLHTVTDMLLYLYIQSVQSGNVCLSKCPTDLKSGIYILHPKHTTL